MTLVGITLVLTLAIAGGIAYPVYRGLLAIKARQTVSQFAPEGHAQKQGTPTMGGLIPVLAGGAVMVWLMTATLPNDYRNPTFFSALLLVWVGFAILGLVDDFVVPRLMPGKRGLGWIQKLVPQFLVAGGAAWMLPVDDLGRAWIAFLIVAVSNAYNFSDGIDGLAGLLLLGICLGLGAWSAALGYVGLSVALAIFTAGIVPFLYLNAYPARIFMGDVGALPIGAGVGLVAGLLTVQAPESRLYVGLVGLIVAVELIPVPIQIFWVKVFKRRLFPYTPIHGAFEKAGWKETRVTSTFALSQLVLSLIAASAALSYFAGSKP